MATQDYYLFGTQASPIQHSNTAPVPWHTSQDSTRINDTGEQFADLFLKDGLLLPDSDVPDIPSEWMEDWVHLDQILSPDDLSILNHAVTPSLESNFHSSYAYEMNKDISDQASVPRLDYSQIVDPVNQLQTLNKTEHSFSPDPLTEFPVCAQRVSDPVMQLQTLNQTESSFSPDPITEFPVCAQRVSGPVMKLQTLNQTENAFSPDPLTEFPVCAQRVSDLVMQLETLTQTENTFSPDQLTDFPFSAQRVSDTFSHAQYCNVENECNSNSPPFVESMIQLSAATTFEESPFYASSYADGNSSFFPFTRSPFAIPDLSTPAEMSEVKPIALQSPDDYLSDISQSTSTYSSDENLYDDILAAASLHSFDKETKVNISSHSDDSVRVKRQRTGNHRLITPDVIRGKKLRKRDQNKTAATRYRLRKKSEAVGMTKEISDLLDINKLLKENTKKMEEEIRYIKSFLREIITENKEALQNVILE